METWILLKDNDGGPLGYVRRQPSPYDDMGFSVRKSRNPFTNREYVAGNIIETMFCVGCIPRQHRIPEDAERLEVHGTPVDDVRLKQPCSRCGDYVWTVGAGMPAVNEIEIIPGEDDSLRIALKSTPEIVLATVTKTGKFTDRQQMIAGYRQLTTVMRTALATYHQRQQSLNAYRQQVRAKFASLESVVINYGR